MVFWLQQEKAGVMPAFFRMSSRSFVETPAEI
jgi:hypothetical protein